MKDNIFLFTGDSPFLLWEELKKWKRSFAEKYGEQYIFSFSSDNFDIPTIIDNTFSWGLFVNKKLVVIFWVPWDKVSDNKISAAKLEQFEKGFIQRIDYLSPDTIVVFVSYDPDKRLKLYKALSEIAQVKEFKTPNAPGLKKFLGGLLGELVSGEDVDYIVSIVGNDMFRLAHEADKLKTYAKFHNMEKVNREVIDNVVYTETDANNFAVLDTMLTDKQKTLETIDIISENMVDRNEFVGMLYWWLKHMLQTLDLYEQGEKDSKQIASKIGVHFFPIIKDLKIIDKIKAKKTKLIEMFDELMSLDMSIKKWQFPAEGFYTEVKKIIAKL